MADFRRLLRVNRTYFTFLTFTPLDRFEIRFQETLPGAVIPGRGLAKHKNRGGCDSGAAVLCQFEITRAFVSLAMRTDRTIQSVRRRSMRRVLTVWGFFSGAGGVLAVLASARVEAVAAVTFVCGIFTVLGIYVQQRPDYRRADGERLVLSALAELVRRSARAPTSREIVALLESAAALRKFEQVANDREVSG